MSTLGSSATLSADDLVLAYEHTTVVHGVSVLLRPGVVTALVGPNGSGKSTLLRSLARLHRVGSGRIDLADGGGAAAGHCCAVRPRVRDQGHAVVAVATAPLRAWPSGTWWPSGAIRTGAGSPRWPTPTGRRSTAR